MIRFAGHEYPPSTHSQQQQINKADYLYNGVGNRTSLTDRRGSQTFGYDNLDRLDECLASVTATPQSFAYDPVGNRTNNGGTVVNAGNQLTADTNHTYQYDDNGNLTRKDPARHRQLHSVHV
jgi:YD repeat-containing protein